MIISKRVPSNLNKSRIDFILKELDLVDSRNQALASIMAGNVFVDDVKILKPGKIIKSDTIIKLKKKEYDWVSRGGVKLDGAFKNLKIEVLGKTALDLGCSTGGFTDVLIKRGIKKVYAVDVGYGQFAWRLRNLKEVILLERTNAKDLNQKLIPEKIDFVVCDVSFISLRKVLKPIRELLNDSYELVCLIKPQFEVEKKDVGKGGIIKDPEIHSRVCNEIHIWIQNNFRSKFIKVIPSSILGQKGNKEFFIYLRN